MKLFIANCTRQPHDFLYRLPEEKGTRMQRIESGAQIQVSGELNSPQIDHVVQHGAVYGLINADEIDRTKPFFGVCYSVDKPISVEKLRRAIEHNRDVLEEVGAEQRKNAAVAISQQLDAAAEGSPVKDISDVKVSVEEEKSGTGDEHEPLNEVVSVDKNGEPPKGGKRK